MSKKSFLSYPPELAMAFVEKEEGNRLTAYRCPAGIWTIGVGHTDGVKQGDVITNVEAQKFLAEDLKNVKESLENFIDVPVSEGQFIALMSLGFNCGPGYVVTKCPKLMRKLNAGDYAGCAKEFLDITKANGKELPGLVKRRRHEYDLFMKGEA